MNIQGVESTHWSLSQLRPKEVLEKASTDDSLVSVFLPTTPNPTSGFLLFVPKGDIEILDMSVEEAAKLIISAGLVEPPKDNGSADPAETDLGSKS